MAKTEHYFTRFEDNGIYHIYNRTVDRKPMFVSDRNYVFFIRQFDKYLSDFIKIYAYSLLGNHFHFMIKVNDFSSVASASFDNFSKVFKTNIGKKSTHDIISHQFRKFFQSYSMAFNKQKNRIGTLFQTPFKRVRVEDEIYLMELICYIHTNAQKHKLVEDFRDWKWTSYHNIISNKQTKLIKEDLINYFNDVDNLVYCHMQYAKKLKEVTRDFFIED